MKKKVLVIDDDTDIVEIVTTILTHKGFEAAGHYTDKGIRELVGSYKPDLILLDIRLHGKIPGTEICKQLKKEFSIPIILFSAELKVAWKDCDADDFIHKPFDMEHLVSIVNSHIHGTAKTAG